MPENFNGNNGNPCDNPGCSGCGCAGGTKMCTDDDKVLVRDVLKTVIMGSQSIDVTREYVKSEAFASYLCDLQGSYQELIKETEVYMRKMGISEDILSSVREAISRGMIKVGLIGTHSDERVAEQLIKGTTMGLETIGNNLNVSCPHSGEAVSLAERVEGVLNQSLVELRKWLK